MPVGRIRTSRALLNRDSSRFLPATPHTPSVGDPGALVFHQGDHRMLLDHLTSEQPIAVTARGQTVDEWKPFTGRENHLFDCCVMATLAASAAGITAVGAETAPERRRRRVEVPKPGATRKKIVTKRGKL